MGWSGGSYSKGNAATGGWAGDASLGIGIEAGRHDTQDNDFATGINQCVNKDGSNAFTGNPNLGGYIPTNLGAGTAAAPALCVGNDVNTGVFGPAADTWAVATNGVERVRVDSGGKINFAGGAATYQWQFRRDANDNATVMSLHNANSGSSASMSLLFGNDVSAGNAGFIYNSSANATNAGVNGLLLYNNSNKIRIVAGGSGGVDLTSGATSWAAVSDERLKKNIQPLSYGLNEITQLQPVRFDYIEDQFEDSKRMGFIAQAVIPVIPEAVTGTEDTYYGLSATELIPTLVNAIKELNTKVETLEAQVEMLQTQIAMV